MVDILFISGSPVKNRNNDKAVDRMVEVAELEGFKFLDKIYVSELDPKPCIDCNRCSKSHGRCYDEITNQINEKMTRARAIIVCSPVYFGSVSAQLKAVFDRTRPLRRYNMKLKDKIGAAAAIGGSRNGGQELTIQTIHAWMHIQGMIIAGDNSHFGGTLVVPFSEDDYGLHTLEETVRKVCDILKRYNN